MLNKGHNIIDAEKLNSLLKTILPMGKLSKFERNFIAYKIAENEDSILKDDELVEVIVDPAKMETLDKGAKLTREKE